MSPEDAHAITHALLAVTGDYFEGLMWLVDCVEHQRVIAKFGYPKDNAFPDEALEARLRDVSYVTALVEAAEEEEEPDARLLDMLRALRRAL